MEGGQTKAIPTVEDHIPTYVRAGAFIPMFKGLNSTVSTNNNRFTLHYYYDESLDESVRQIYMDSGVRLAYEKGEYEILEFKSTKDGKWLEIDFSAMVGSQYNASTKTINLVIHNISEFPQKVTLNKNDIRARRNSKDNALNLNLNWNTTEELKLRIKLK